ncbi:MPN domain-containing protein-like isoform X4 [Euwallacea similis]|uniref:MPN domain-containing protein-like isoform X4 n=1 Tax=Euwallacea similis TaxID=1736056 RepID=UPI00344CD221
MQSQLAAALLGHNATPTSTHLDDDENNSFREEDTEVEQEEFDEETESETHSEHPTENGSEKPAEVRQVVGKDPSNRTVTLQMLLSAGILKPGAGAMTIEYLGQKFVGDLLEDGKIRSQETDIIFASPSAWAIACKRFINPDKKSGCGWASVKYKGKKLDAYKNVWYKKKKEEEKELEKQLEKEDLQITHAFPCRNTKADRANAPQVEAEIARMIEKEKLTLVGWYHSHPFAAAAPTLRDVDAQLEYQIKMRGTHDNSYTPCIGIIISPYNYENVGLESSIMTYWVIPPPENKPNEYGRPMLMSYNVIQDSALYLPVKTEMTKCVEYYKKEQDFINFNEKFMGSNTFYIEKLKGSLASKFPRDENEADIWKFVRENLECLVEERESLMSASSAAKSTHLLPTLNVPVSMNSGLGMLSSDISSLLFNAGKYSSAGSILGLPDPMAHSTLAANNMFLQTNLFKMQELLKPFSPSSPSTSTSKSSKSESKAHTSTPLKASKESPVPKQYDFSMDLMHFKDKMNFLTPDLSSKMSGKDFSAEYLANIAKSSKTDFYMPNLSVTKGNPSATVASSSGDYSLNLGKPSPNTDDEKPSKIARVDFSSSTLDLSYPKASLSTASTSAASDTGSEAPTDLSMPENVPCDTVENDGPLNLTGD